MHSIRYFSILLITFITIFTPVSLIHVQPVVQSMSVSNQPFNQEIIIPIDTAHPQAAHQPIDIRIHFDNPCWAKNKTHHSIRVAYHDGHEYNEIESQIYDLSHTSNHQIDSCSIVFLIPEDATGKETYHVFYSNKPTDPSQYPNRITVIDTRYFYEPITGQIMNFEYYQIREDDNIIYGICQRGELLGNGMSNTVVKLLPGSKEFSSKNAEQIAGFFTSYSINPPGEHTGTQWARDISKAILVEGNLMTRIRIKGTAPNNELVTDNVYTYYYNPTDTKRLMVHVNHQTKEDIEIQGDKQREGSIASLTTIKSRSGTIDDMNLGEIFPKIHFHSKDGTILDYDIPTDPDAHPADWILGYRANQKLGSNAWISFDDPATGRANGLIFEKNTDITPGKFDGIQVKASVHQHVNLPGLVASSGDVFAMRNAYENGKHRTTLAKGEDIQINLQYISIQTGGHEIIDKESALFQELIKHVPLTLENETIAKQPHETPERYTVKASVHGTFSAPLGSLLSAALGRNISYLTAELHEDITMVSSGSVGRLKFNTLDLDVEEDATFIETMRAVGSMFDFRNSTLFKTITFTDIDPGTYLIKIYKENPLRHEHRQFIGYDIITVSEDTSTWINCKPQTTIEITIADQNGKPLKDAETRIYSEDILISRDTTDETGKNILPIPLYTNKEFTVQTIYDGFLIDEESMSLGVINRFRPWKASSSVNRHTLKLRVTDTLGLSPGIDPRPTMQSEEMKIATSITPEQTEIGSYLFTDLYEATYDLTLRYKSWEHIETVSLTGDSALDVVFPAEFVLETTTLNQVGNPIPSAELTLTREGKTLKEHIDKNGVGIIQAPPGTYTLRVSTEDALIAAQQVTIRGDRSMSLVSNQASSLHQILPVLLLLAGFGIGVISYWKTRRRDMIYIFLAFIVLSSVLLPWWQLHGKTNEIETVSETYLYPPTLVTRSEGYLVIGGEISEVPEIFTTVLSVILMLLLITSALMFIYPFISRKSLKLSWSFFILIILLLIITLFLFWVTMSEVTKIGIGDFSGSGNITLSLPGESDHHLIVSTWGIGTGMVAAILAVIGIISLHLLPLINQKLNRKKDLS